MRENADHIEQLFIESHLLTITSELITPHLLRLEEARKEKQRLHEEKSLKRHQEIAHSQIPAPLTKLVYQPDPKNVKEKTREVVKIQAKASHRKIVHKIQDVKLVPIRLKSGQVVRVPKCLLLQIRQKSQELKAQELSMKFFKIQSDSPILKRQDQVPFTDRLSPALHRLSKPFEDVANSPLKSVRKNGKISKAVKLRAALDKSTIAWNSTTKLRPKATLLDQLNAVASQPGFAESPTKSANRHQPKFNILTDNKNRPQTGKNSSNLPVVIKIAKKREPLKTLPMRAALKFIESFKVANASSATTNTANEIQSGDSLKSLPNGKIPHDNSIANTSGVDVFERLLSASSNSSI